jgi:hypothetical protein
MAILKLIIAHIERERAGVARIQSYHGSPKTEG